MTSSLSLRPAGSCGVVKVVNEILGALSLEKNPDKTFIGGSNAPLISSTITSRVKS
jgi:hypothetical protein